MSRRLPRPGPDEEDGGNEHVDVPFDGECPERAGRAESGRSQIFGKHAAIRLEHEEVTDEGLCSVIIREGSFVEDMDHDAVEDGDEQQRRNERGINSGEPLEPERTKSVRWLFRSFDQREADQESRQHEEDQHPDVLHERKLGWTPWRHEEGNAVTHANHLCRDRTQQVERYRCIVFRSVEDEHSKYS